MLEQLATAFGVGIEELIYGEKRNIGLEPPKTDFIIFPNQSTKSPTTNAISKARVTEFFILILPI